MNILSVRNLGLSFAGLRALQDINFEVREREIFGLIGPNGAGKTTLLNCLSRIYEPDSGSIRFNNIDLLRLAVHELATHGISRTFQNLELFAETTVRENILIGTFPHFRPPLFAELFRLPSARRLQNSALREVDKIINELGLEAYADQRVSNLPYGIQKTVELGRALAARPKLLLLDEPAAGANPEESRRLGELIVRLRESLGITILVVEHDMSLVMNICDRILAIDHGQCICLGTPLEVRSNPIVLEAYLGQEVEYA